MTNFFFQKPGNLFSLVVSVLLCAFSWCINQSLFCVACMVALLGEIYTTPKNAHHYGASMSQQHVAALVIATTAIYTSLCIVNSLACNTFVHKITCISTVMLWKKINIIFLSLLHAVASVQMEVPVVIPCLSLGVCLLLPWVADNLSRDNRTCESPNLPYCLGPNSMGRVSFLCSCVCNLSVFPSSSFLPG